MIAIAILILIVAKALPGLNTHISSIQVTRITSIVFLFAGALSLNTLNLENIGSGIGIYSGFFQVTTISQLIEIFLFLIGGGILIAWPISFNTSPLKGQIEVFAQSYVSNHSKNSKNYNNNNNRKFVYESSSLFARNLAGSFIDYFLSGIVCLVFLLFIYYMFESYFIFIITFYISFLVSLYVSDNFKYSSLYLIRLNQKFAITIITIILSLIVCFLYNGLFWYN